MIDYELLKIICKLKIIVACLAIKYYKAILIYFL